MSDLATSEPTATTAAASTGAAGGRAVRGRYAKFNGGMDVLLLEAIMENNPFTAKHGTRLQMWQSVAEIVGEELFKNPDAYSWHTCRDRVTALLKMYADGKHDKLFKQGTAEENARKEAILSDLSLSIARKNKIGTPHAGADSAAMLDAADIPVARAPTPVADVVRQILKPESPPAQAMEAAPAVVASSAVPTAASLVAMPDLKRRRLDITGSSVAAVSPIVESSAAALVQQQFQLVLPDSLAPPTTLGVSAPTSNGTTAALAAAAVDAHLDGSAFRARVLHLIESKVQFDMEQRTKETQLREQEFELQKRFLEYLQSK